MRVISRRACFSRMSARIILMPPPVEPAQVVNTERNSISTGAKIGHWLKSVFAKPVVVAIETVLNSAIAQRGLPVRIDIAREQENRDHQRAAKCCVNTIPLALRIAQIHP